MKRLALVCLVITILSTITVATGITPLDQSYEVGINEGNRKFEEGNYDGAIKIYEGLIEGTNDPSIIKYNIGLAHYHKKDYQQAIEVLADSDEYMLLGNSYYRLGIEKEGLEDKIDILQRSADQYMLGIQIIPNSVDLKYNYEFVNRILEDLKKQQEKQNNNQDNKDNKDNKEDDNSKDSEDNNDKENQEKNDNKEKEGKEDSKNDQGSKNQPDNKNTDSSEDESGETKDEVDNIDEDTLNQVLKLLEQQERESLKNNQSVIEQGREEANDW